MFVSNIVYNFCACAFAKFSSHVIAGHVPLTCALDLSCEEIMIGEDELWFTTLIFVSTACNNVVFLFNFQIKYLKG
ncbi:hypothetical protein VNO80_04593 [Phaseolus coccineus]|uniref:Uncharacterized protein n=1 Tax=Phaseolus coccineus TaxID=3886 RepID=A0AAN9NTP6_PHACN